MEIARQFGIVDFGVFFGLLALSLFVGLYHAFVDRKKNNVENYYFGERRMATIPVGLSMGVTFISAITILGFPNHAYVHGTITFWFALAPILQLIISWMYYIPMMHRLRLSSVYEFLEKRFHRSARLAASSMIIVSTLIYMGTALYLSALALDAVTSIGIDVGVVITAVVCTIYTTLGGMKAVVWTDAVQSSVMLSGVIAVLIRTITLVGGFGNVLEAVYRGGRNTFFTFDMDPTLPHTAWTIFVGAGLSWVNCMCNNQAMTQRYVSCKDVKSARKASIIATLVIITLVVVSVLNGCAMYAYYEGCDPMLEGKIEKVDQTISYLVLDIFNGAPGMAGWFVSAAYSGMLSTLSSGINAMSILVLNDYILLWKPKLNEKVRLTISKVTSFCMGMIVLGMAFFTKAAANTVVQFQVAMMGTFAGAVLGIYALGLHVPWTNSVGAFSGALSGMAVTVWISVGSIIHGSAPENLNLPLTVAECNNSAVVTNSTLSTMLNDFQSWNTTEISNIAFTGAAELPPYYKSVYSVSYLYYPVIGMVITIVMGVFVSLLTGKNDPKDMDPRLFAPLVDNKYLPNKVRQFFRFGVPDYCPGYDHGSVEKIDLTLKPNTITEKHLEIELT